MYHSPKLLKKKAPTLMAMPSYTIKTSSASSILCLSKKNIMKEEFEQHDKNQKPIKKSWGATDLDGWI